MVTNIEFLVNANIDLQSQDKLLLVSSPVTGSNEILPSTFLDSYSGWTDSYKSAGFVSTAPYTDIERVGASGTMLIKPGQEGLLERSSYITDIVKVPQGETADSINSYQLFTGVKQD